MSSTEESDAANGITDVVVAEAKRRALMWVLGLISPVILPILAFFASILILYIMFSGELQSSLGGISSGAAISPSGSPGQASNPSGQMIPPEMLSIYQSAIVKNECPGLPWQYVAAIGHVETGDWQNKKPSSAGAVGPMQFMPATWSKDGSLVVAVGSPYGQLQQQGYALDGDGDGIADVFNPNDAVPAAARYLCANGGGDPATLTQAIYAYNHADWYVFGGITPEGAFFPGVIPTEQQIEAAYVPHDKGIVLIDPGANIPGEPVKQETMNFLETVAGIYGKPLICTTGTNHTFDVFENGVDTGRPSDHSFGHACDFGMVRNGGGIGYDSPVGDAIDKACLIATGEDPASAEQDAVTGGGGQPITRDNVPGTYGPLRVQCIWKAPGHHDHVHIGAAPE